MQKNDFPCNMGVPTGVQEIEAERSLPADDDIIETIQKAMQGDAAAFSELVVAYQPLVAAVCRAVLKNPEQCADAMQDAFVRAYLAVGQLRDPARFKPWLRRVAYSVCMNRLQKRGREGYVNVLSADELDLLASTDAMVDPSRQAEALELARSVAAAVERLPETYREPIRLFYMGGLASADIAQRMGLRDGAVRARLARGLELLKPALAKHWDIDVLSRNKQLRGWLPMRLVREEVATMTLQYETTQAQLPRREATVTIRPMTLTDIPAMRTFDIELSGTIDEINAAYPPDGHSTCQGGPWSDDAWLAAHFEKYRRHGGMTLLATEDSGRIVGFADLWPTEEPEPFGRGLTVQCIDYFREYYLAGLETTLLAEAEKVARAAGIQALDIGTNTCSGEYISLRRFGLKVFYEYDDLRVSCRPDSSSKPARKKVMPETADLTGLVKINHWSPTDFAFRGEEDSTYMVELNWPKYRTILELWHFCPDQSVRKAVPQTPPNKSEIFAPSEALRSADMLTEILRQSAVVAGELGAKDIRLSCPSEITLDDGLVVLDRQFAFAWLRKSL